MWNLQFGLVGLAVIAASPHMGALAQPAQPAIPVSVPPLLSNCAQCFRLSSLAIKTSDGQLRDASLTNDFGLVAAQLSMQVADNRALLPIGTAGFARGNGLSVGRSGPIAYGGNGIGEAPLGGFWVTAPDSEFFTTFVHTNGQWVVEVKGLVPKSGQTLGDAFVQNGFCEGAVIRIPRWQLMGGDNRPLELPVVGGNNYLPTVENGVANLRALLATADKPGEVAICTDRLTAPPDFYEVYLNAPLQRHTALLKEAISPAAVDRLLRAAFAEFRQTPEFKSAVADAVGKALAPAGPKPAQAKQ